MYALTLWQPWATLIVAGPKRIENRPWPPPKELMHQRFAIHAGKKIDPDAQAKYENFLPDDVPMGSIVGTAKLVAVVTESKDPWFFGPYGWVLDDVRALEKPIRCRGYQKLWTLPEDIAARLE